MNLNDTARITTTAPRRAVPLQYWFAGAVVLGAVAIFVGEGWGGGAWVTLGVPIAVMAFYIAIGRAYLSHGISRTQYADSIYYLGFLFTLAAITAAIIEPDLEQVLNRFGVKLITTLIGLGVRVYLVNFTPSTEDVAENVEESLAVAARRLRDRLDAVTLDLDALTSSLALTLKTASERVSGEIGNVLVQAGTEFGASLGAMKTETTAALRELRAVASSGVGELSGNVAELERLREQMRAASRKLAAGFEALVERIEGMQLPDQVLARDLAPVVEGLVSALREPASRLAELSAGVAASSVALSVGVRDVNALAEGLRRLQRELENVTTGIAGIPPLERLQASVERAERSLARLGHAADGARRRLSLLTSLGEAIATWRTKLRQLFGRKDAGTRR